MKTTFRSSWKRSDELFGTPYNQESGVDVDAELYPNPFTGMVTVKLANNGLAYQKFNIEVYNQLGARVKILSESSYNSLIDIDLKDLLPGLYVIRMIPESNEEFERVQLKAVKLR